MLAALTRSGYRGRDAGAIEQLLDNTGESRLQTWGKCAESEFAAELMFAAAADHRKNHQIRGSIEPFLRWTSGRLGGAAQMLDAGKISQMLGANAGDSGDFFFCKDLLAGPDCWAAHISLHPSDAQ